MTIQRLTKVICLRSTPRVAGQIPSLPVSPAEPSSVSFSALENFPCSVVADLEPLTENETLTRLCALVMCLKIRN